jgi:membrane associated rhomboid family serine protease
MNETDAVPGPLDPTPARSVHPTALPALLIQAEPMRPGRVAMALIATAVSFTFLLLAPGIYFPLRLVILGYVALNTWSFLRAWLKPVLLQLDEGELRWRVLGRWGSTPADNVLRVERRPDQIAFLFRDPGQVRSLQSAPEMDRRAQQAGYHVAIPGGAIGLWQVNELSHALGLGPIFEHERTHEVNSHFDRLRAAVPSIWATPVLIGINVLVYLAMSVLSPASERESALTLSSPQFSGELLYKLGADFGPATRNGEPWRLLTHQFLHLNLIHVALNMWILSMVGKGAERVLGNVTFLAAYLFAGACGGAVSVMMHPMTLSAGASGAVFGIFGMLLGVSLSQKGRFPAEQLRQIRSQAMTFLVLNLIIGMQIEFVDNAAHIGGAIGGLLCGLLIPPKVVWPKNWLAAPVLVALGIGGAMALPRFQPSPKMYLDMQEDETSDSQQ